ADDGIDFELHLFLNRIHGEDIGRVGHGDQEAAGLAAERDDLVAGRELERDEFGELIVDRKIFGAENGNPELFTEGVDDFVFADDSFADEELAEFHAGGARAGDGLFELLLGEQAGLQEHFADFFATDHGVWGVGAERSAIPPGRMWGVMKMTVSLKTLRLLVLRKRPPRMGRSLRNGIPSC